MLKNYWTKQIDGATYTFTPGEKVSYCGRQCQEVDVNKRNHGDDHSWDCGTIFVPAAGTRYDAEAQCHATCDEGCDD